MEKLSSYDIAKECFESKIFTELTVDGTASTDEDVVKMIQSAIEKYHKQFKVIPDVEESLIDEAIGDIIVIALLNNEHDPSNKTAFKLIKEQFLVIGNEDLEEDSSHSTVLGYLTDDDFKKKE
jgi:hypothetical protein